MGQVVVGGDVIAGDYVDITGESVFGGVLAQGDVSLRNVNIDSDISSELTYGVQTYANYSQNGGLVKGGVRVLGDVSMLNWGSLIDSDDLRYEGVGAFVEFPDYANPPYKVVSGSLTLDTITALEKIPFDDGVIDGDDDVVCDPLNIAEHISSVDNEAGSALSLFVSGSGPGDVYEFGTLQGKFTTDKNSSAKSDADIVESVPAMFLSEEHEFLMFDDIEVKGHLVVAASSDVMIYVKGNFSMGGQSSLTIPDGSSLSIVITGTFDVGAGAEIYTPTKGLTDEGLPVLSIYSAYVGDGISISGGAESIYATVYAPNTDVTITSSSDFFGAVLGNTVSVTGSGAFHYDAFLGEAIVGPDPKKSSNGKFQFLGFKY